MEPNKPQESESEQERDLKDVRQNSGVQALGQRNQSSEIWSSCISSRSRISEQWSCERQNKELWIENQSLKAKLQENIKAQMERLRKAQQEKQKMQKETRNRIDELTKKEQQQKDQIRDEYETRIKKLTDDNVRLVNMKQNNDQVLQNLANHLSDQLNEKVGEIEKLQLQLAEIGGQNDLRQQKIQELELKLCNTELWAEKNKLETERMNRRLNEKVEEAQTSQTQMREKEEENKKLNLELKNCKVQTDLKHQKIQELESKLRNAEQQAVKNESETEKLKRQLTQKVEEAQTNQTKMGQKDEENKKLKVQLSDHREEVQKKLIELRQSKDQIEKLKLEKAELKTQSDQNKRKVIENDKKLLNAKNQIQQKGKENQSLKKQFDDKVKEANTSTQNFNANKRETERLRQRLTQFDRQVVKKQKQIKQTQEKHRKAVDDIQKKELEIESLKRLINIKEKGISTLNKQSQTISINSDVLQNEEQLFRLCGMFEKKKVIGFNLLFRASDHDFDVKYKWKYCGVAHTVLLVKTHYGKVIGGYTPLKWKISKEKYGQQFQYDTSGESFIFSISNNHKLTLESTTDIQTVWHHNEQGPIFSCGIRIPNESNTLHKSLSLWGNSLAYVHPEYKAQDKDSWTKFVGSSDAGFYTQQWEVHRVIFEEQP